MFVPGRSRLDCAVRVVSGLTPDRDRGADIRVRQIRANRRHRFRHSKVISRLKLVANHASPNESRLRPNQ